MLSASLSRRSFLKVTSAAFGGLCIGIDLAQAAPDLHREGGIPEGAFAPDAWLRIMPDDRIVFVLDRTEMGQGVMTALAMLLAEELEVDPTRLEVEKAPADRAYVNPLLNIQMTGGSTSVAAAYTPLRMAGAAAREMLIAAAARRWGVAAKECRAESGVVRHKRSGKSARYGELATAASDEKVPEPRLKPVSDYKIIGSNVPRLDGLAKVTGRAGFGIDVDLPGLTVAVVKRCPVLGGKPAKYDPATIAVVPGIVAVIEVPTGIAIVAERFWQARKAASLLEVEWTTGGLEKTSSEGLLARFDREASKSLAKLVKDDDMAEAFKAAAHVVKATYQVPYLAHATMEPVNCTANVTEDACDVWAPTQAPGLAQQLAVEITGLPHAKVRIHTTFIGGGFGRRLYQDYVVEAVEIARRLKRPVKVQWTREDDVRHDIFRPASAHHLQAALDKHGDVTAWAQGLSGQSILSQCVPAWLRAILPEWLPDGVKKVAGSTAGGVLNLVGDDKTAREGADKLPYATGQFAIDYVPVESHVPVGFWRSVGHSYTGFVVESFVDELAHAAGQDPLAFRRRLLARHPRHLATLDLAAEKAGWGKPLPAGVFRGLAQHESFGTCAAQIVEISVEKDGSIRVHRVVCAVDCGLVIHPDLVVGQMEGGIIFGLSAALFGEITIKNGAVEQSNFHDYPVVRLAEAPRIEVHIVPSKAKPSGVGEPGVPPVAPAVANAVFAATGKRLRKLPLKLKA